MCSSESWTRHGRAGNKSLCECGGGGSDMLNTEHTVITKKNIYLWNTSFFQ